MLIGSNCRFGRTGLFHIQDHKPEETSFQNTLQLSLFIKTFTIYTEPIYFFLFLILGHFTFGF